MYCCTVQGYVVYSQRNKLRPELQGLDSAVIKALRQSGQEVTATIEVRVACAA